MGTGDSAKTMDGTSVDASTNKGNAPAGGSDERSSVGMGASKAIESIGMFPNIKTLVASDSKLSNVDLGELPHLEYVDLRGNEGLTELDYCIDSVEKLMDVNKALKLNWTPIPVS